VTVLCRQMMNHAPIAVLVAGILLWHSRGDIETVLPRVICAAACLAAIRAASNAAYRWATAFGGIAVVFNPIVPDMLFRIVFTGLYFIWASVALLSLAALKAGAQKPTLSLLVQSRAALDSKAAGL
jgi:hypothetical protein